MPDQKLSLEDILSEFTPDPNEERPAPGRVYTQKILNSTMPDPSVNFSRIGSDTGSHKVTVVDSDSFEGRRVTPNINGQEAMPHQMNPNDASRIRPMSDSSRAKEIGGKKNKRKSRKTDTGHTYNRESPEGEYVYTPPKFKKKKKSREAILAEAADWRNITDIVPSPAAVEAARPVEPAPRAEKTSIDLTARPQFAPNQLDVHITQDSEEYLSVRKKAKRTKRIVDFNYYGDVEDVGRDIFELKSIISVRVFILMMTAFLSLYMTAANQFGIPIINVLRASDTRMYLIAHLILGLISILSSMAVMTKGLNKFMTFRPDSDSMTAITALTCFVSILPGLIKPSLVLTERVYMPVGILALLFNAIGKSLIMRRAARNFKFVSKNFDRHGIVYVTDEARAEQLTRGTVGDFPILASMRKTDFLTDFLRYTYSADMTDRYCRRAAPLCVVFSVIFSLFMTAFCYEKLLTLKALEFFCSTFALCICGTSCVSMPFAVNIPLEKTAKKAFYHKGIMLGYQSVDDFYDTNSVLVDADTFFPEHKVTLDGIKVFSNTKIEEALLEAASLTHHAGSIMRHLFTDVVDGKDEILYPIENFSFEESMGICGWIHNRRVLFGNRELMTAHNIEGLPTKNKEAEYVGRGQEAMYLSISGNLAALFTVNIGADREVKKWARQLCKEKIYMIIKSVDPCITVKKISNTFCIPQEMLRVLPKKLHEDFEKETEKAVRLSASMACTGKFSSLAQLILGTKAVHTAAIIGLIMQTVSIILGFGLAALLIVSKAFQVNYFYMSAAAVVGYHLIWTVLTYIAVSFKKI